MADGTIPGGAPAPTPTAPIPQSAPVGGQPPIAGEGGAPAPDPEGVGLAEARAEMDATSPDDFLKNWLGDNGIDLVPDGAPPVAAPPPIAGAPPAPTPYPTPPPGNAAPPAPNGAPPAGEAHLVGQLFAPPPPSAPAGWPPAAPSMQPAAQGQPPAPAPAQSAQPEALEMPFKTAFELPPQIAQALSNDDPNVRNAAIGAVMASAANAAFEKTIQYVEQKLAPQITSRTFGQVQQYTLAQTVERELFGNYPHLRMASPQLIEQAATVIVRDEMSRDQTAGQRPPTAAMWKRIGALATEGIRHMAGGQVPPAPQALPPGYPASPPPAPQPSPYPGWVWNGQQWVAAAPQPPVYPNAPPSVPYYAGQGGMPFGMPPGGAGPTPQSELQQFMENGGTF